MSIDYTSYSNDDVVTTGQMSTVDDAIDSTVEDFKEIIEVAETETDSEETEDSTTMLKVVNCEKVYVRADHSKKSDPVATVSKDAELLCIPYSKFNEEDEVLWHHVVTESGAEGYIMADFTEEIAD